MPSTDYVIIIGAGILALLDGFFLGLMPMNSERLTPSQRTWSQVASLIGIGLVVVLILIGQDTASWAAIAAMIAGIIIGIVPPVKTVMQTRFTWLQPEVESDRAAAGKKQSHGKQTGDKSSPAGKSKKKS
ncbi:hypothetical protein [Bifidobacterium coryneforme]|uniref:Uncharacterized protein n=1 Tax=Bifidobacterium [indicum] DSM 20214 = LMG 11587 TaxID=1341694 RepID=A0A087VUA9_9BIFI|nr:hypothetical protein [Bifidobacterium indicum]AIC91942.1 hypothetical protein BINDI_0667 [Bifidobacterium indicum LMG 11587 = DSM 20214]